MNYKVLCFLFVLQNFQKVAFGYEGTTAVDDCKWNFNMTHLMLIYFLASIQLYRLKAHLSEYGMLYAYIFLVVIFTLYLLGNTRRLFQAVDRFKDMKSKMEIYSLQNVWLNEHN